ncbi:DNA fragmentation factor subunit beta isoform X2 [Nannospalax galili]|uniref:DNA fragmentation factor subunit beta isoform X2 n=1 Tax=Nannospalax galili TaxID=1026970 RepID=UPI00111C8DD9|nr:DNA fragmentation factor subunit beta isoform X2 [Nannospalax galili]
MCFRLFPPMVTDVSDISRFLSVFHEPHSGVVQAARKLLSDEQSPLRQKLLSDLLHHVSQNIAAETREQDPSWFEAKALAPWRSTSVPLSFSRNGTAPRVLPCGVSCLEPRFRNKSGYLRYSCESRIRSYLREVSAYTSMVDAEAQEDYSRILRSMCQKLRSVHYNGSYFDRGAEAGGRLCTTEGWFSCQGPFDLDSCSSKHSINPYGNRESRILFSTWNLDHIIEKKRTIVPTLAEAVQEQAGREVDWEYFYSLLFTSQNLKLVHIACHKKTTHKLQCDRSRIYRARTGPGKHPPARKRR